MAITCVRPLLNTTLAYPPQEMPAALSDSLARKCAALLAPHGLCALPSTVLGKGWCKAVKQEVSNHGFRQHRQAPGTVHWGDHTRHLHASPEEAVSHCSRPAHQVMQCLAHKHLHWVASTSSSSAGQTYTACKQLSH